MESSTFGIVVLMIILIVAIIGEILLFLYTQKK